MIQKLIDEHIAKEQEERKDRVRSGLWSPSSFGRCFRYQYWNRTEEPSDPLEPRVLRIFKAGKLFHTFVQDIITKEFKAEIEVEVNTEDIKGFADIVSEDTVWDLKTVNSRAFFHMDKEDINISKKNNILQVMTYAWILGKPKGNLVFIEKDALCIREYGFFLEKWEESVKREIKTLKSFTVLPPASPRAFKDSKGKFRECGYCGFRTKCKEVANETH